MSRRKTTSPLSTKNLKQNSTPILLALSLGLLIGLTSGFLLQPFLNSLLQPQQEEKGNAKLEITIDKDCKLVIDSVDLGYFEYNYFDYEEENITQSQIYLNYGIFLNDSFTEDIYESAKDNNNLKKIQKDLDDNWDKEDGRVYSSLYPETILIAETTGSKLGNVFSKDLIFPPFNFTTGEYTIDGNNNEIDFSLEKPFMITALTFIWNFTYEDKFGLQEGDDFFFQIPIVFDFSSFNILDPDVSDIDLRDDGFVLNGDDGEIKITEIAFDQEDTSTTFSYIKLKLNGENYKISSVA